MYHTEHDDTSSRAAGRSKWVLIGFLAIAAFFLLSEHRAHLLGVLPYLLFLACPLMHLFHHGHGHRHDVRQTDRSSNTEEARHEP